MQKPWYPITKTFQSNNPYYISFYKIRDILKANLAREVEKIKVLEYTLNIFYYSPIRMNPQQTEPTTLQTFMDSTVVSYGLKII